MNDDIDLRSDLLARCVHWATHGGETAWIFEQDRWAELVYQILCEVAPDDVERLREAVGLLHRLDALLPGAAGASATADAMATLRHVLAQTGLSEAQIASAQQCVAAAQRAWGTANPGLPVRTLRQHAERARDAVVQSLGDAPLPEDALNRAVTRWLHHGFGLPLPLGSELTEALRAAHRASDTDLWREADALGINLAELDRVLTYAIPHSDGEGEGEPG